MECDELDIGRDKLLLNLCFGPRVGESGSFNGAVLWSKVGWKEVLDVGGHSSVDQSQLRPVGVG